MMWLALVLVLLTPEPPAQTGRSFAWWDSPVVKDLGLSPEQTERIRAAVRESRTHLIQLRAEVERVEEELKAVMAGDPVDTQRADEVVDRLVAARADLFRAVSRLSMRLRQVLAAGQWAELQRRRSGTVASGPGPPD